MQRLHERDPSGHLISQLDPVHLCLPNEYDGDKHHTVVGYADPRDEVGELLCPAICDAEETEKRKHILGRVGYAGQYQQAPVPAEGIIFQEQFFQFWEAASLPRFDCVVGAWDLNDLKRKRATRDTDYVVGQVWGAKGPDRYLLGQFRKKIGLLETVDKIQEQKKRWPDIQRILIEAKANGPSVIAALTKRLPTGLVEGIKVQGESKVQRAVACQPAVEGGNVFLPSPDKYPWVREKWIPEVCGFPNRRRDDQVDAMTMALIWFTSKTTAGLWFGRLR
jgi:predicted phage terminase large subunit-like protein